VFEHIQVSALFIIKKRKAIDNTLHANNISYARGQTFGPVAGTQIPFAFDSAAMGLLPTCIN